MPGWQTGWPPTAAAAGNSELDWPKVQAVKPGTPIKVVLHKDRGFGETGSFGAASSRLRKTPFILKMEYGRCAPCRGQPCARWQSITKASVTGPGCRRSAWNPSRGGALQEPDPKDQGLLLLGYGRLPYADAQGWAEAHLFEVGRAQGAGPSPSRKTIPGMDRCCGQQRVGWGSFMVAIEPYTNLSAGDVAFIVGVLNRHAHSPCFCSCSEEWAESTTYRPSTGRSHQQTSRPVLRPKLPESRRIHSD